MNDIPATTSPVGYRIIPSSGGESLQLAYLLLVTGNPRQGRIRRIRCLLRICRHPHRLRCLPPRARPRPRPRLPLLLISRLRRPCRPRPPCRQC